MYRRLSCLLSGALLLLILGACGQQPAPVSDGGAMPGMEQTVTPGMDQGDMPGMDHRDMSEVDGEAPYDARFIDSMIEHHTGAISMAEQALQESERPEIRELAQAIITDQQKEIDQMQAWREEWFPDLPPTGGMGMEMGDMEVGGDPSAPFDQRFINAMIAHHNGVIAMARDAKTNAERDEIKQLAAAIIMAQEAEVQQLQEWNRQWFGG